MPAHDLVGQVCDRAGNGDRAAVHGIEAVGDLAAEIDVLFDEQDGQRLFLLQLPNGGPDLLHGVVRLGDDLERGRRGLELLQRVANLVDDRWLDALGGFVEDEQPGFGKQGAADGELLLLAAGEHAAFAREHFLKHRKEPEHVIEGVVRFGTAAAVDHEADLQVFRHREVGKDVAALRNVADAEAGTDVGRQPVDPPAGEGDCAGPDRQKADDGLQGSRLAHAIASHQGDDFAGADVEGHPAKYSRTADVGLDGGKLKKGLGQRVHSAG